MNLIVELALLLFTMIIYNVTINSEDDVHDEWSMWMKGKHIPDMLATGKFISAKMCKVVVEEEMGGTTYSIQYTAPNRETLEKYYTENAALLRQEGQKLFRDKFVAFRTELELVNEQTI